MKRPDPDRSQKHRTAPKLAPDMLAKSLAGVQVRKVELVHSRFSRTDDGPLPPGFTAEGAPEVVIDVDWEISDDRVTLGCLVRTATVFPSAADDEGDGPADPYAVQCEYRVLYVVRDSTLTDDHLSQIAYWDATKVAWPYFRADLSSVLARADLPQVILPILQTDG